MTKKFLALFFILINVSQGYYIKDNIRHEKSMDRIAFGSCFLASFSYRDDIFQTVTKTNPELFIWLGDAAYLDTINLNYFSPTREFSADDAKQKYNKSKFEPNYHALNQKIPTIGVYDDHDYGLNDGNGYFPYKELAKNLYLDFVDEPADSKRRQPGRGIYTSYSFGEPGTFKTFKVILLDVRYDKNSYLIDSQLDMLGEEQWKWFEDELTNSDETFVLIVSGTQILPVDRKIGECWYNESRKRLIELLGRVKRNGLIFLTGDIHLAQFLRTPCVLPEVGYHIWEVTSSGLAHHNPAFFQILVDYFLSSNYYVIPTVADFNFGTIDFKWGTSKETSSMSISIRDRENYVRGQVNLNYRDISFNPNHTFDQKCYSKVTSSFKSFEDWLDQYKNNPIYIVTLLLNLYMLYWVFRFFLAIFKLLLLPFKIVAYLFTLIRKSFSKSKSKTD